MRRALSTAFVGALTVPAFADTPVAPPAGWIRFCTSNSWFCQSHGKEAISDTGVMTILRIINQAVNGDIEPEPLFTAEERRAETRNWRLVMPGDLGACVEYALFKEAFLIWAGIPREALTLAIVFRPQDRDIYHMVLLVRVGGNNLVLDSLTPIIWRADQEQWDWIEIKTKAPTAMPG